MSEFIKFKDTASLIVSKEIISFLKEYEKKINNLNEESKIDGVLNEKLLYEKAKNLSTEYLEKFIEIARHDLNGNCFKKLLDKLPSCCSCKN
jgi:hypothetical protein